MNDFYYIEKNYKALTEEIAELAKKHGQKVTLVSVTKSGSDEELLALCKAGAVDIGENRPQELARRGQLLREAGFSPRLHEIGNLQRNKVKSIIEDTVLIHSVDSLSLAAEIDKQADKVLRCIPVLIEVNCAKEEAKGGILPDRASEFFESLASFKNIKTVGIMTMGPVCENAEDIRPYFRQTKKLFDRLNERYGFEGGGVLSMGMTDSYRIAIEEGSTLVRVGRKLFRK